MVTPSSHKSPSKYSEPLKNHKKVIEANGVKYLVTETEGRTKSGRKIRSCKWETYQPTPTLF